MDSLAHGHLPYKNRTGGNFLTCKHDENFHLPCFALLIAFVDSIPQNPLVWNSGREWEIPFGDTFMSREHGKKWGNPALTVWDDTVYS